MRGVVLQSVLQFSQNRSAVPAVFTVIIKEKSYLIFNHDIHLQQHKVRHSGWHSLCHGVWIFCRLGVYSHMLIYSNPNKQFYLDNYYSPYS